MSNNKKAPMRISKKISCLSFKKLENYFRKPDLKIQDLYAISAQQFTKDLDSMIAFSKNRLDRYGKIDNFSITIASDTSEKGIRRHLTKPVQKHEKAKQHRLFNKLFKFKSSSTTKIKIKSWNFTDFDGTEKFQVGKFYTIKPNSVTYNSTKQDYKYNKQIISEFSIEKPNENIKNLIIIDNIKKGKIIREKYIDGQKINHQHYNFEIRNHNLNRGLMKTFLFHKIYKYKTSEYNQENCFLYNNTDLNFAVAQPKTEGLYQTKETIFSSEKARGKFPEEYVKTPYFTAPAQNQKKTVDINNVYNLQNKYDDDDRTYGRVKVQRGFKMESDLIYVADDYSDLREVTS